VTEAFLLVAVGGAVGSMARHGVGLVTAAWLGSALPWGTLLVNVVGSFLIAIVAVLATESARLSESMRLLLATGVMGGFTTYSSFSLETLRLFEAGETLRAGLYLAGTTLSCMLACAGGLVVGRALGP
jgi:CrcB protein